MKKIVSLCLIAALLFVGCSKSEVPIIEKVVDYGDGSTAYIPQIELSNINLAMDINNRLEQAISDNYKVVKGEKQGKTMEGFSAFNSGDLVSIFHEGYFENADAPVGVSYLLTFHINTKNGNFYTLDDLLVPGYSQELQKVVESKLDMQLREKYIASTLNFSDVDFDVYDSQLVLIFEPQTVATFSTGFVNLAIPFSEIEPLLNTTGEFYNLIEE